MSGARGFKAGMMFLLLTAGALFVLFPLFWMVSTSFKVKGKGLLFEFVPQREATYKVKYDVFGGKTGDIKRDRSAMDTAGLSIAFADSACDGVTLAVSSGRAAGLTAELVRDDGGVWRTKEPLPADTCAYAFHVRRGWKAAFDELYTTENYTDIIDNKAYPFKRFLWNSFLVSFCAAFFTVALCSLAAYVFAKKNFPGKQALFWTFMAAMMIPGMMYMVPQFALVTQFGWINSLAGLVVPHLANVFGLFMLKQFMESIPDSLLEAARIDGAGEWTIFRRIIIPLSMPSLWILFLLTFVGQWNNFLWQLLVNTPDSPLITIPVGIQYFRGQYSQQQELMMAASSFSVIPIIVLFLFTQRYMIEGLTAGGVKE